MKSNEEFIAGIYEKAAAYTEEGKIKQQANWKTKAVRIAAMAVVCVGLAGAGTFAWNRTQGEWTEENHGIALLSEQEGVNVGTAMQFRRTLVTETVTFTGRVAWVDTEEKRIWLTLEFVETAPQQSESNTVCIYWDLPQEMDKTIKEGIKLTATGELSVYEKEGSKYSGCAELVLTDAQNLWLEE